MTCYSSSKRLILRHLRRFSAGFLHILDDHPWLFAALVAALGLGIAVGSAYLAGRSQTQLDARCAGVCTASGFGTGVEVGSAGAPGLRCQCLGTDKTGPQTPKEILLP